MQRIFGVLSHLLELTGYLGEFGWVFEGVRVGSLVEVLGILPAFRIVIWFAEELLNIGKIFVFLFMISSVADIEGGVIGGAVELNVLLDVIYILFW